MTNEQAQQLIETVTRIDTKMELLITNGGSKGLVPDMQRDIVKHAAQINFWRGAVAVIGLLTLLVGTALAAHIYFK